MNEPTVEVRDFPNQRHRSWFVVLAVWFSFVVVSLVAAPIPAVNEPHYLAKAKHFWNPDWCRGDLFLESFPAHQVFYAVVGWWTEWFDFTTVAIVGRIVANGLLAASWVSLLSRLQSNNCDPSGRPDRDLTSPWMPLLSAWCFAGLQAIGNFSGEWLIGGFESKVLAYSFAFWSVTAVLDRRWMRFAVLAGATISFHPIIGLWHLAACLFALSLHARRWGIDGTSIFSAVLLTLTAAPGLWPAVQMLRIADPKASYESNYIQVFHRLKHHLDPMDLGWASYLGYGLLLLASLLGFVREIRMQSSSVVRRWWRSYLLAAFVFALAGVLVGWGPRPGHLMPGFRWRMVLLKFYPFRLFDLVAPLTAAALWPVWSRTFRLQAPTTSRDTEQRAHPVWWLIGVIGSAWALTVHQVFPPSNQLPPTMRADWLDVCRWVAKNTPPEAIFHTPFEAEAFKWHAQRAEYVNNKDCPQDAAGLVEWNRRQRLITKWSEASFAGDETYSADELRALVRMTNVRWAITRAKVRYDARLLYRNDTYKILWLPAADESEIPAERAE